ncbi:MAG: 30S ribosomal protein S4 [Candidatus Moranbacteria bacterium RBG_13_45_13]|nr:MAG: 30S ribosomal protein S4 [Candidatus Moranbacteria bacterium RBG_13_45_13]
MARILPPKCKLCRRAGEKLFLKGDRCSTPKCAMVRRAYPPGAHGTKKGRRPRSEFGEQLAMKQKVKRIYGILEKQLKKYFQEVKNKPGITGDMLMQRLEMRFDNVVFRAGFSRSRSFARQLVRHSFFLVNGKSVNIPSFAVRIGDVVRIKESKKNTEYVKQLAEEKKGEQLTGHPKWLNVSPEKFEIEVRERPTREDFGIGVDAQMVVEFYSR